MNSPSLEFTYAFDRDQGARAYQEDSVEVWRKPNGPASDARRPVLAVLADGMGGHVAGEQASQVAIARYLETFSTAQGSIAQLLEHSLIASNDGIESEIRKNPMLNGMGCTLVAAYLDEDGLRWVSVGDSSLLLYRRSTLIRLNEDHSIGALLDKQAQANQISFEDARNDPRRRILRSALVGAEIAAKDLCLEPHPLYHGDWVILASDGLETLRGDEVATIVGRRGEFGEPASVVKELLDAIKRKAVHNQDNVSIVVIKIVNLNDASTQILSAPLSQAEPVAELERDVPGLQSNACEAAADVKEARKPTAATGAIIVSIVLLLSLAAYNLAGMTGATKLGAVSHPTEQQASPPPSARAAPEWQNRTEPEAAPPSAPASTQPSAAGNQDKQPRDAEGTNQRAQPMPPSTETATAKQPKDAKPGGPANPHSAPGSAQPKAGVMHKWRRVWPSISSGKNGTAAGERRPEHSQGEGFQ
jgi:serine/threonine protein phosphatase PrpC